MRYIRRTILHSEEEFLEVAVYDEDDIAQLADYCGETRITLGMDMLEYLEYLPNVRHLILTSGELGENGYEPLYNLNLISLKIDYENDSEDDPKIDLTRLPRLELFFRAHR